MQRGVGRLASSSATHPPHSHAQYQRGGRSSTSRRAHRPERSVTTIAAPSRLLPCHSSRRRGAATAATLPRFQRLTAVLQQRPHRRRAAPRRRRASCRGFSTRQPRGRRGRPARRRAGRRWRGSPPPWREREHTAAGGQLISPASVRTGERHASRARSSTRPRWIAPACPPVRRGEAHRGAGGITSTTPPASPSTAPPTARASPLGTSYAWRAARARCRARRQRSGD